MHKTSCKLFNRRTQRTQSSLLPLRSPVPIVCFLCLVLICQSVHAECYVDPLTGLLTRGAFFEIHEREVLRASRTHTPTSIIMADLDHFKQVNDRYGHMAGDDVLREAARAGASQPASQSASYCDAPLFPR